MVPALFHNMKRALLPLLHNDTYEVMNKVVEEIEAMGNRSKTNIPQRFNKQKRDKSDDPNSNTNESDSPQSKRNKSSVEDGLIEPEKCLGDYCAPCYEIV